MSTAAALIALNRFGLGARPGEAAGLADPGAWLRAQADHEAAPIPGIPSTAERLHVFARFRDEEKRAQAMRAEAEKSATATDAAKGMRDAVPAADRPRAQIIADLEARISNAVATEATFTERLAMFWSNHLAVSARKGRYIAPLCVPYENEAIRPHVCGRFADMLIASAGHPAMMLYLDSAGSIGPDSFAGQRGKRTYNENYAREVMELHTVGVGAYSQPDVVELALALTGLGIDREAGTATWRPHWHQPGERTILGHRFAADTDQMHDALEMLALHPATARRLSAKLAAQFCGDNPPPALVAAMAHAWQAGHSALPPVYRVLLNAREARAPGPRKYKTPEEFVISAGRALGLGDQAPVLLKAMHDLSQVPFTAEAPTGFSLADAEWLNPAAVVQRISVAATLAAHARPDQDPVALLASVVSLSPASPSVDAVASARGPRTAFTLLLASPEFQRR